MLYLCFTCDGDWGEYFDPKLPEEERAPKKDLIIPMIKNEIDVARRFLDGKILHFIHTSSRARDFFYGDEFMPLWKQLTENGGDTGLHCHEDDPGRAYHIHDTERMKKVIKEQAKELRKTGLDICSYRGGYLAFSTELIPILEEAGLSFDFSCEPERYLEDAGTLISDWRAAPRSAYRMSYNGHRMTGDSRVFEIPLGMSGKGYLYFEKSDPETIERVALELRRRSEEESRDIIVSVLTHTYEYASLDTIKSIQDKISILKKYGKFINLKELKGMLHIKGKS